MMQSKISKIIFIQFIMRDNSSPTSLKNQDEFHGYLEAILMWFYMTSERYFRTSFPIFISINTLCFLYANM